MWRHQPAKRLRKRTLNPATPPTLGRGGGPSHGLALECTGTNRAYILFVPKVHAIHYVVQRQPCSGVNRPIGSLH
ncbi:hypothetical protein DF3PA_230013 [Candidatus Defluviicoccus seviourii]|uniref:Uncharacterized protein n=1 Tax=Candidatus Defluviicoccus seviourii TaxID=2565273 RepID=A0A564WDX8_9PROT|nr:hypothetical protein DF3PA_230013 [Candidatus Defluviicoccus seviourii]